MMSKEKRRVPKLRFPGFTEDWEQRKLSDISTKVTTKNVDVHYTETLTNSAEQGIISQVDFFDKEISNKDNINGYYIVDNNDFIYNPRISTLAPVGPINRNKLNRTGIMSPLYTVFRLSNVDLVFLEWYFQSSHWHRYMKLNGDSGARADRIAIKDSTFFEMPIKIPVNIKEQVLIGETLEKFNQYITLHQRKLDNLKLKKKALLQKLFPKNGERYPKLRFPGFTDAWEQRKLGDYLIQYTEITTQNNQYPVLTSSRKGLFFQTDYYDGNQIASKDNTGYNIVPYGYFTYRHMSDDEIFHFNINYIVNKGIVSTLYPVFTTKNLNSNYLQLQLNYGSEFRKYAVLLKQGGSRTYMYFNKLKDLKLTISTSIDEQEIIAKFFISFEKLITLHQRKLDHLKLQKKALLQQMFV